MRRFRVKSNPALAPDKTGVARTSEDGTPAGFARSWMGARVPKLLSALVLATLLLVATSTVLLWRLVDQTADLQGARAGDSKSREAPLPPPLPESKGGTTTRALAQELDRTTAVLARPLEGLQDDLGQVPPAVKGLLANTSGLQGLSANIGSLVDQTRGLAGVQDALLAILKEIRQLRQVRRMLGSLNRRLGSFGSTLSSTNGALRDINATLQETNKSLDQLRECLRRPVLCK